jgi:PadR family transcriptional regulator, regulatory protein PadR
MGRDSRLSLQTLKVLRVFLEGYDANVRAELAGADVMRRSGISSGTTYPILLRLEEQGLLASHWESDAPEDLGRPRRRFYALTGKGARVARAALSELAIPTFAPSEA